MSSPLSSVTSFAQQFRIIIGYKHACDQDTEDLRAELAAEYGYANTKAAYIKDKDTPEDALDGLGDVPSRIFGLSSCTKGCRIEMSVVYVPP